MEEETNPIYKLLFINIKATDIKLILDAVVNMGWLQISLHFSGTV